MGLLLLVRHGQASFGAADYDVLSDAGWEQSRVLGRWLGAQRVVPTAVVSGGMRRHRETAEGLLEGLGSPAEPTVDAGWAEFDHLGVVAAFPDRPAGELDRRGFQRVFEGATARWTGGEYDDDYHESWTGFVDRVDAALARAAESAGPGSTVVVVSSGGPISVACAALVDPEADHVGRARLWAPFNTTYVNTGVTRVVVGPSGPRLLTFNEHSHLPGDLLTYR
ncbi:histidine phosphatase family protein [Nocardioides sp. LHG3406-4]|uniref:histidine phosphatase family protein n=1 Tax=Nocardioides sp. LHG3406-4 TaxID=2804575 RepID=UPI003CE978CA